MVEFLSGVPERFEQTDADLMVTLDDSPEQAPRAEGVHDRFVGLKRDPVDR
jgi:hypothetical protein